MSYDIDNPGLRMKPVEIAGILYGRNEILALRNELIELRDQALNQGDFNWSVKLSHLIGWMHYVAQETNEV